MKTNFYTLLFILFSNCLVSQCELSNLNLNVTTCDMYAEVYISIDFDTLNVGAGEFIVEGPLLTRVFNYDGLPVLYGPFPGNCQLGEIIISDYDFPSCAISQTINECCDQVPDCNILGVDFEMFCDLEEMFIEIGSIQADNPSSIGAYLSVIVNGQNFLTQFLPYSQSESFYLGSDIECDDEIQIRVVDAHRPCEFITPVFNHCCCLETCDLDLVLDWDACGVNDELEVFFNLNASCNGDLYDVYLNNNYLGQFDAYDNGSLPDGTFSAVITSDVQIVTFEVCSVDDPTCCDVYSFEYPCPPPCGVQITNSSTTSCNNGLFDLLMELDSTGSGNQGYWMQINSTFIGNFPYSTTDHYNLDIQEQLLEIIICDEYDPSCCTNLTLSNPCYFPPIIPCSIFNLNAQISQCINDTFSLAFSFDTLSVGSQAVAYLNQGDTNVFSYDSIPTFDSLYITDSILTLIVCDLDSLNCCDTIMFLNTCVPGTNDCSIDSLSAEIISCSGSTAEIELYYEVTNPGPGFEIQYDGVLIDTFAYDTSNSVVLLVPTICPDSIGLYIQMTDLNDSNCLNGILVDSLCCPFTPCDISNLDAAITCAGDTSYITITFDTMNVLGFGFLDINGVNVNFIDFDSLGPYVFFNTMDSILTVVLCDEADPNCCDTISMDNPCYVPPLDTCNFTSLTLNHNGCVTDSALVYINYTIDNPGALGFEVSVNGVFLENFQYLNMPTLQLPGECSDTMNTTIKLTDLDDPTCYIEATLDSICCDTTQTLQCAITNLTAEANGGCVNGLVDVFLEMDTMDVSTIGYDRWINGIHYGQHYYDWTFTTIYAIPDTSEYLEIIVCDAVAFECCDTVIINNPCYLPPVCNISNLHIVSYDSCDLEFVDATFKFNVDYPSARYLIYDNFAIDTMYYSDTMIWTFFADCLTEQTLYIQDLLDPNCIDSIQLGVLCCDTIMLNCRILDLTATTTKLSDVLFDIVINLTLDDTCPVEAEVLINEKSLGIHQIIDNQILLTSDKVEFDSMDIKVCFDLDDLICKSVRIANPLISGINELDPIAYNAIHGLSKTILQFDDNQERVLGLLNIQGQLLQTINSNNSEIIIEYSNYPSGLYILKITQGDYATGIKFIKP